MSRLSYIFLTISIVFLSTTGAELSYRLVFRLHPQGDGWALEGEARVTGRAPEDALVFRFFQGYNVRPTLKSVVDGDTEIPWNSVDPTAIVLFPAAEEGQTFSVTVSYFLEIPPFPDGGYGTLAAGADTVSVAQAYPFLAPWCGEWMVEPVLGWGDSVVAEVADYTAGIEAPPGWEVVATGVEGGAPGITLVSGENLREFSFVLLSGYERSVHRGDGIEVCSWYLPEHRAAGEEALRLTSQALELYAHLFGVYPFPELDIVEVPLRLAAGVEFPGLILAAGKYYRRYQEGRRDLLFPMIFAHEAAHQWWYAQVGNDQVREPWVDEALATYTSGFAMRAWGLFEELRDYWERTYGRGRSRNAGATPFDPLWEFPEGEGYGGIVYSGGALFFLELEAAMGRDRLISALRRYLREYRWEIATGEDLLRFLREEGGAAAEAVIGAWRRDGRP